MLRGVPTRRGSSRRGLLVACALTLPVLGVGYADALDGVLEVRSAYVNIDNGVFLLHARVEYPVNPAIRDALRDGVTLTFDLDTRVERDRRFWFNATIVELTLRRELAYHAVSDRYVVRDVRSGEQQTFANARRGARLPRQSGRLADSGGAAARRRQLHHQRARGRASRAACPPRCERSCSGRMTGSA